jgi:hypothetical protein
MEFRTTLFGLAILALCIYIFVLLKRSRKNKEKILINQLRVLATGQAAQVEAHELGLDFGLGIDETNRYLFYTRDQKIGFTNKVIDLVAVKNCTVAIQKRQVGKEAYMDKVSLIFHPEPGKAQERIILFDSESTALPNGEPLMAKRWAERVNELLKDAKSGSIFRVAG